MTDLYKYGVAVHLYKPMVKRAAVDFAVSADWTPAAGDVKISKDGGAAANVTNLPTAITMGNTAMWDFSLTATEMQAAKIRITVADAATKAVEDNFFEIDTYGNASAQHAVDFTDATRMGLTALPNANAEAAGGLYTRGSGAGQINQQANGQHDVNVARWLNTAPLTPNTAGLPKVDLINWLGAAPAALASTDKVQVSVAAMQSAVITAAAHAANAIDANALATDAVAELVAGVRAMACDGTTTLQQMMSVIYSVLTGITTSGGVVFKAPDGTTTRLTVTTDGSNNRTASTPVPAS